MIAFALEPLADDVSWSPDWRPENLNRPQHPDLMGSDFCVLFFNADVQLVIHGVDLSLRLAGVPVVDFALMLEYATRELETGSDIAVETTYQHVFSLSRGAKAVTLTTDYAPHVAELTWDELLELTARAKSEAVRLITAAHPELRDHEWLRETVGA
ncbi:MULTISPECIES: hypothetical protein [Streptomyces]|uniref:Uncharacterized protein n=2 Tax=Streptomyces TaxID=1883 RepID=A0ABV9IZN7_9ACTN